MSVLREPAPFVARVDELRSAESRLQGAIAGRPWVTFVRGEAGIGKTRFLREFAGTAREVGASVCVGRCFQDLTFPYRPFVAAVRALLEQRRERPGDAALDAIAVLQGLIDPQSPPRTGEAGPSGDAGEHETARMFFDVSEALLKLARLQPVLLVLEDLHWADHASLDLLDHLVFAMSDASLGQRVPLMIVASYRPDDLAPRLSRALDRFQREDIFDVLDLAPLEEPEIRRLMSGLGFKRASNRLVSRVAEKTCGNPLFIEAVVHHLREHSRADAAGPVDEEWVLTAKLRLPKDLIEAVTRRLESLSEASRDALMLGACLGERFRYSDLQQIMGAADEELARIVDEAIAAGLIHRDGRSVAFAHASIRQILYDEIGTDVRRRLHARIADSLERADRDRPAARVVEIAHHLQRAGGDADPKRLIEFAGLAGDRASNVLAWGEAARHYEAAASAASASGCLGDGELADLHFRAGSARYRELDAGACFDSLDRAMEAYRRAGDLAGMAQVAVEKTRAQLTQATVSYGMLLDVAPLQRILDALGDSEPMLRGKLLAQMSQVHWTAQQPEQAGDLARQSLDIGLQLGHDRLCIDAYLALALAQTQTLQIAEALASYRSSLTHSARVGDPWIEVWPLPRIPMPLIWLGQIDRAEPAAAKACNASLEIHDWAEYSMSVASLVMLRTLHGDLPEAEEQARRCITAADRSSYPWGAVLALPALACARSQAGAQREALDALALLAQPGRIFDELGIPIQVLVVIYQELLRTHTAAPDVADEATIENLSKAVGLMREDAGALGVMSALVEIADQRSFAAVVERLYPTLELANRRGVVFSTGWIFLIPRILGVAAALLGRWDTAEEYFEIADRVAANADAGPERGRTCLDHARMLLRRGRNEDRSRVVALLERAISIFRDLAMEPWIWRCEKLAAENRVDLSPADRRPHEYPDHLGAREVEVLVRAARGQSEEEIASGLLLMPETVRHYLSTMRAKTGAEGRAGATSYAFEKGLLTGATAGSSRIADAGGPAAADIAHPVVILVTDMVEFTPIVHRLGDAEAQKLIRTHNFMLRGILRKHRGSELQHTGDGIMAYFQSAPRAIDCAVELQRAFSDHTEKTPEAPLRVRIGLHAGRPLPEEDRLFGSAVIAAHRICSKADGAQILISEAVRVLAGECDHPLDALGSVALKGFSEPVELHRVRWEMGGTQQRTLTDT